MWNNTSRHEEETVPQTCDEKGEEAEAKHKEKAKYNQGNEKK